MKSRILVYVTLIVLYVLSVSCRTTYRTSPDNSPGRPTVYEDPSAPGRLTSIGIESQDIVSMTDRMMRDMLGNAVLATQPTPPRVIIDSAYFKNDGSQRINKDLIADRLRVELTRAANGRLVFIARHAIDMVEHERELKQKGVVDLGTKPLSASTAGADYRLTGSIKDLNQIDTRTAETARYVQVTFEMVDLDNGIIVWTGIYEFKKSAQDDIVYRED